MNFLEKQQIIQLAATHCQANGARLTPIRQQVLEIVLDYTGVVKAYDVLADLQRIRGNAAPPTVYRALDFLVEMQILHRAESLNGFVFCKHFCKAHISVMLSCRQCGAVEEYPAEKLMRQIGDFCQQQGFSLEDKPFVFSGICRQCASA